LSRPDDGFSEPAEPAAVLLGQFNKIYGASASAEAKPVPAYHGKVGFILD
jgi:pilus assembly protein CpaC